MSNFRVVEISDGNGTPVDQQHPLPVDGDSVYVKDVWVDESATAGFTGSITDLFDNRNTIIVNSSATNPKEILLSFHRTTVLQSISFGAYSGNFSNIKILAVISGGLEIPIFDESADNTKYTSRSFELPVVGLNALKFQFHTADTVTLSNLYIPKIRAVVSRIQGQKPDGTFITFGATDSGNLKTSNAESGLAIAKGDVIGSSIIHKFGDAPDFDTSDGFVNIWDGANDSTLNAMQYTYSTTNDINRISSSDNGDVQDVEVQGLDVNYNLVVQTITLTGQTPVVLPTLLLRVFRMKNVGSVDIAGQVYCYTTGATVASGVPSPANTVRAMINNGNNQTLMALYTIPAGYSGYMRDWYTSTSGAKRSSSHIVKVFIRPFGQVFQIKHKSSINDSGVSYIQHKYTDPEPVPEKADIQMLVDTDQNEAGVSGGFDIVLVEN
jgi:hypothetical protein